MKVAERPRFDMVLTILQIIYFWIPEETKYFQSTDHKNCEVQWTVFKMTLEETQTQMTPQEGHTSQY